jgi:hypothetical protein
VQLFFEVHRFYSTPTPSSKIGSKIASGEAVDSDERDLRSPFEEINEDKATPKKK